MEIPNARASKVQTDYSADTMNGMPNQQMEPLP